MKTKILLFISAFFLIFTLTSSTFSSVYICTGNYSKKYHYNKNCRGLSNCKATIESVSLQEAKDLNRTLCGWED